MYNNNNKEMEKKIIFEVFEEGKNCGDYKSKGNLFDLGQKNRRTYA